MDPRAHSDLSVGRRADALNQDMPYSFEKRRWKWERIALRGCFVCRGQESKASACRSITPRVWVRGPKGGTHSPSSPLLPFPPSYTPTPKKRLMAKVSGVAHSTYYILGGFFYSIRKAACISDSTTMGLAGLVHAVAIASTVAGSRISNVVCELGDYLSCPGDHGKLHSCYRWS